MSIFDRIARLLRANVNDLISSAEQPEKMLNQIIIDMRSPGIEHRPIPELTGRDYADFNEVFFTDVVVPADQLVGVEIDGWKLSMGSLAHERAMLWIDYAYDLQEVLDGLVEIAKERGSGERFRDAVASSAIDAVAMQAIGYRQVVEHLRGERGLAETIELVKIKTRQFAKRQLTWFRRHGNCEWMELQADKTTEEVVTKRMFR